MTATNPGFAFRTGLGGSSGEGDAAVVDDDASIAARGLEDGRTIAGLPDRNGQGLTGQHGRAEPALHTRKASGIVVAQCAQQRTTGEAIGAEPVQNRLGEATDIAELLVGVQRVAVPGQPIQQSLIVTSLVGDGRVRC